jgi:sugar/nucleoside kinase (ribokinase family)
VSPPRVWDVLGVGDADVDLFLGVERLPGRDEKVMGEYLGEHPGGVVANFCCAASRLGARTALVTVVGEDRYGKMAVADLEAHDVDTSLVKVRLGGITYFCVVPRRFGREGTHRSQDRLHAARPVRGRSRLLHSRSLGSPDG